MAQTKRYRLLVALAAVVPCTGMAEMYKWTDPQGHIHYTDKPAQGSKIMAPQPVQTYEAPRATIRLGPERKTKKKKRFPGYTRVEIAVPKDAETIWDNAGNVTVTGRLEPELQSALGHQVKFVVDGAPIKPAAVNTSVQLENIDRGEHQLQMLVVDAQGTNIAQSAVVNFHLKRISVVNRPDRRRSR